MKYALLFILGLPAFAAITNVQVLGTTNTQAVISYTAPDSAVCSLEVSKSASYAPLVHDVNPALFPGGQLDSRLGSVRSEERRVGKESRCRWAPAHGRR